MLDAARKARRYVQGRERTDLEMDEMLSLAIVRLLEIVGEAHDAVSWSRCRPHCPASLGGRGRAHVTG